MGQIVIYSSTTGRVRRIVTDDAKSANALEQIHLNATGESAGRNVPGSTLAAIQAEISTRTGLTPTDDRYAIVASNGEVTGSIIADPAAGDSIADRTLVAHATARAGWRQLRNGTFQRPLAVIDRQIAVVTAEREVRNSTVERDRQAAKQDGLTEADIDALVAEMDALLATLATEKTAREAVR